MESNWPVRHNASVSLINAFSWPYFTCSGRRSLRRTGGAEININALSVSDATDHAVVRIVVDHPRKAIHLLGEYGFMVVEREVLMIEGRSQPGELAEIARKLAKNKINIEYAYTTTPPGAKKGIMILRVDNLSKAGRALADP